MRSPSKLPRTLILLALSSEPSLAAVSGSPLRVAGRAFDFAAEIEVRDREPAAASATIAAAFVELERVRPLLRAIEQAAVSGRPVQLEAPTAELVRRAQGFCYWSEGRVGLLGGELFRLWGLRSPRGSLPTPAELGAASAAAACERLTLDEARATMTVAAGSSLDFFPFELGWAVDRAAELLRAGGSSNFLIAVGPVVRAAGPGPDGKGWKIVPPLFPGLDAPLSPFYLRDRALAILTPTDRPLAIAGETFVPYIDFRRARPGSGLVAVMAVGELGVDAAGVAYTMYALGPSDGLMLAGSLAPRPSVRWLLGAGAGPPVLSDFNWSAVPRK